MPLLLMAWGIALVCDWLTPPTLWFGPVYLFLVGYAAWMLGGLSAAALGMAIMSVNFLLGTANQFPYESNSGLLNFSIKAAAVLGIVVLLGNARKALEREWTLARTDHLTGALNRQAFFEELGSRDVSPCWSVLFYADLDGLKRINDSIGHKYGDKSIVAFAERIRSAIRAEDLFARMGGDEFVIFMNVVDEQAGIAVAQRLNQSLNVDGPSIDSTALICSLGVLILPPGRRSIDVEMKAADMLMYEAKRLKIGMLSATASITGHGIALSRHVGGAPANHRNTEIRSYQRDLDAEIKVSGLPHAAAQITTASAIGVDGRITHHSHM